MPRLSKVGAAALAAFGWTSGASGVTASYLVVAGGGGGGAFAGGAGAGGGYRTGTATLNPSLSYTVTVGAGGGGAALYALQAGGNGSDSVFSTITSTGGGGGGNGATGVAAYAYGQNGGSGGGSAYDGTTNVGSGNTPSTSPSQGNNGGQGGAGGGGNYGGGGGGAGGTGGNFVSGTRGGNGGAGTASSISGASVTYAGGGGGAADLVGTGGTGGTGGGNGGGARGASGTVTSGTANLGGGGGGAPILAGTVGGNGGSGIVIISYVGAQQFGGGVVTSSGGNTIHTFTTSGTLVPVTPLSASYLVVAGGGGGGIGSYGGGGGAGGLLSGSGVAIDSNSTYLVTVGSGGAGGANGTNSAFSMVSTSAVGGGRGGTTSGTGAAGGSGGGGGSDGGSSTFAGGAGTSGQGNAGGNGLGQAAYAPTGGGGGAGAAGGNAASTVSGNGGVGVSSSISGTATFYAGGGGGGILTGTRGTGGNGGGGNGGLGTGNATSGTANTGGGGGGIGGGAGAVGAGGSGIVVISYAGATQLMAGGTVTISGGNVIHTFTSTGYLAPLKYVGNSLRFRLSASAYLNRTPSTAGNSKTFTINFWVKRGIVSTTANFQRLLLVGSSTANYFSLLFGGSGSGTENDLGFYIQTSSAQAAYVATTAKFRDPSAWYMITLAVDTTQATASNRVKIYINGVQQTALTSAAYPTQNTDIYYNSAVPHYISENPSFSSNYFDGYIAEFNSIDGQALTPSSFGTFNSYGVWQPITYGGSYGTNGFYLPFNAGTSTYAGGFNGSAQYLVTSTNASLALGTNSFTIEYWLCITASAGGTTAVSMGNGTTTYDSLFGYQSGAGIILYLSSNGSAWDIASGISMGTTPVGTWNHVAVTRSGNTFYTFLNGVQVSTFSSSASIYQSANSVAIARAQSGSSVNGNISNVRVVVGTALYTSNFTIPTSNLTAVTNTKLLTLQNATIVDNSTNALTFTNTGSVVTGVTYPFSAAKIFNDQGPQGNNWTPNNISGAFGSTLDYMTDVPTLTSATAANYAVLNAVDIGYSAVLSEANLKISTASSGNAAASSTMAMTGNTYWEVTIGSNSQIGLIWGPASDAYGNSSISMFANGATGSLGNATRTLSATPSWSNGDTLGFAWNNSTRVLTLYQAGSATAVMTMTTPATGDPMIAITNYTSGAAMSSFLNCGQRPFTYTPPTGYVALNTYNL